VAWDRLKTIARILIFPQTCVLCGQWIANPKVGPLCEFCRGELPALKLPVCELCGSLAPASILPDTLYWCSRCRQNPIRSFDRCRSWGLYEGALRKLVHHYKYGGEKNLASVLAELLQEALTGRFRDTRFDLLVPVPSHRLRLKKRGFDHIRELTEKLSRSTGIREYPALTKLRDTVPQQGLTIRERQKNLKNAFRVLDPERINRKRILIIDDVLTTGTTVSEVAATLRRESDPGFIGVLTVGRVAKRG